MEITLFSARSLQTMLHGILLSGGALAGLAIALFSLIAMRPATDGRELTVRQSRSLSAVLVFTALALWLVVISGTYVIFPPYRATPVAGEALGHYPRALLLASPGTAWLHSFAMEIKEHMPWIVAMLTTAAASIGVRHRATALSAGPLRSMLIALVAISLTLAAFIGLLGIFVNKAAPLQ